MQLAGFPPRLSSARTCPSPGRRISSASAPVGIPAIVCVSPRTRTGSPKPKAGNGGTAWALAIWAKPGMIDSGLLICSPARSQ